MCFFILEKHRILCYIIFSNIANTLLIKIFRVIVLNKL
nr:MAG TPA: hypothetical protein [Caudoviricetes sp.]